MSSKRKLGEKEEPSTKIAKVDIAQPNSLHGKGLISESHDDQNEVPEKLLRETSIGDFLRGLEAKDLNDQLPESSIFWAGANANKLSLISKDKKLQDEIQQYLKFDMAEFLNTGKKIIIVTSDVGLRIAVQDYKFDVPLTHDADVKALEERLNFVRQWHSEEYRGRYMAPLLPVIQSSGTGKSRALFELRKELKKKKESCRSILLTNQDESSVKNKLAQKTPNTEAYDEVLNVTKYKADKVEKDFRDFVVDQCRRACSENDTQGKSVDVALFFDEAQHLTANDGFLFKVLRRVTREKTFKITVVLAGTTSSLANFFPETQTSTRDSRYLEAEDLYHKSGVVPYEPFFVLRTQGCLSNQSRHQQGRTEYENMIRFSRPLFQVMQEAGKWDINVEYDIALKIVLGHSDWTKNMKSCLSVLATRVQMGATSASVVSDLVSEGYAHLTFFRNKDGMNIGIPSLASIAFLPDPVCARMAMCLMDENFTIDGGYRPGTPKFPNSIKGTSKTRIVETMGKIFSSGLCLPAKGDLGEIAVALYLLFCGDILRAEKNDTEQNPSSIYHNLSVDFSSWMDRVWNKGSNLIPPTNFEQWNGLEINCIQFFRYSFRSSLEELGDSTFLESLYRKGCAIYCPTNTEAIGLVIPCHDSKNDNYIPIFVSVKNYGQLYPATAVDFLKTSYDALEDLGIDKGLLLLGIAGQDGLASNVSPNGYEAEWEQTVWAEEEAAEEILVTAGKPGDFKTNLCVGFFCVHDDRFKINKMLQASSFVKAQQQAEVYSMHSELIHVKEELDQNDNLPRYNTSAKNFYKQTLGMVKKSQP